MGIHEELVGAPLGFPMEIMTFIYGDLCGTGKAKGKVNNQKAIAKSKKRQGQGQAKQKPRPRQSQGQGPSLGPSE